MLQPHEPLERKSIGVGWKDARELAPKMQVCVLVFSERLAGDAELSKRFLAAYLKAIRWYWSS